MTRRSAYLTVVLLACSMWSTVPSVGADPVNRGVHFDQIQGFSVSGDVLDVSGWSTTSLDEVTWYLSDLDTQERLVEGGFLDHVLPDGEDRWTWDLGVNVSGIDCTCALHVVAGESVSLIVVYIGSPTSWRPVWNKAPPGFIPMVDGANATLLLDIIFPPGRGAELNAHGLRCPSTANGVCQGEAEPFSVPVVPDGAGYHLDLRWSAWSTNSLWNISSFAVTDTLLASTKTVTMVLLLDDDIPSVTIDAPQVGMKDAMVRVAMDAQDVDSGLVEVVSTSVRSPSGTYLEASDISFDGTTVRFVPTTSGVWMVHAEVVDAVGHRNESQAEVSVRNLPPELDLRLDGGRIVSGEQVTLPAASSFELNASQSTDTPSDVHALTFVWWVNEDTRIVDRSYLTQDDFSDAGVHAVRVEVVDGEGASTEVAFSLTIEEPETRSLGEQRWFGSLSLVVSVTVLGLLVVAKRAMEQEEIPTWPGAGVDHDDSGATVDRAEA